MKKSMEIEELKSLIDKGLSSIEISTMYNINQGTVSAILKREGLPEYTEKLKSNAKSYALTKTKGLVESKEVDFDRFISNNYSYVSMSREIGLAPQTIRKYIRTYRPELDEEFVKIGRRNKVNLKVTEEDISQMLIMSSQGMGIDAIGKVLEIDGTTVRRYLIDKLGEEEYSKRHPVSNYIENNGWNGKRILYKGVVYQSQGEVDVAKKLHHLGLDFETHKRIVVKDKVYIPDFYIPSLDLYIEYAGILTQRFYRVKFMKKVNDYSISGIKFLVVNEENLDQLESFIERSDD